MSFYYSNSDPNVATLSFAHGEIIIHTCYKALTVVLYYKDIRKCLEIAYYVPVFQGPNNTKIREFWLIRSVWFTYTFFVLNCMCVFYCNISPLIQNETYIAVRNNDGSSDNYRMNVVNLYFFVSNETYNNYFNIFYPVEILFLTVGSYFVNVSDMLIITLCLVFTCQLQTIRESFESVGHNYTYIPPSE